LLLSPSTVNETSEPFTEDTDSVLEPTVKLTLLPSFKFLIYTFAEFVYSVIENVGATSAIFL
jgi:hypothetical protein